jgi:hypothetical protein
MFRSSSLVPSSAADTDTTDLFGIVDPELVLILARMSLIVSLVAHYLLLIEVCGIKYDLFRQSHCVVLVS